MLKDWMDFLMEIFGFTWNDENRNGVWDPTEGN